VPRQWLDIFDERELELLLCGLGNVDVEDWKGNCDYRNCDASTPVVCPAIPMAPLFLFVFPLLVR
jgi:hypothetical protein